MPRYIDADAFIKKLEADIKEFGEPNINMQPIAYGSVLGIESALDLAKELPTADVVPKSEVEKLVQDGTRLGQENETLKDNNEHLAVMLEEAKSEVERLQAKKDALIKNYAECMKDYAREIFEEIDNNLQESKDCVSLVRIFKLTKFIAELKKKYTEIEK